MESSYQAAKIFRRWVGVLRLSLWRLSDRHAVVLAGCDDPEQ